MGRMTPKGPQRTQAGGLLEGVLEGLEGCKARREETWKPGKKAESCKCRVWLSPLGQVELRLG